MHTGITTNQKGFRKFLILPVFGLFLIVIILFPSQALASSISVQPLRQELELNPGEAITSQLLVTNTSNDAIKVQMSAESFGIINEDYDYSFAESEASKNWVKFAEQSADINPKSSHSFIYSIGVPNNAEPGERYIAVFASVHSQSVDQVSVVDRLGQLSYITVSGNITRRGEVLNLALPRFTWDSRPNWSMRFQNFGTAHFTSNTSYSINNILGQDISKNSEQHLVLPGTIRRLEGGLDFGRFPGLYKVSFQIGQGDEPAHKSSQWVIYAPLWFVVTILILALTGLNYLVRRKRK